MRIWPSRKRSAPRRRTKPFRRSYSFYRHVIGREVGDLNEVIRARKPTCPPVAILPTAFSAGMGSVSCQPSPWLLERVLPESWAAEPQRSARRPVLDFYPYSGYPLA
jgi:hypothetical protein